MSYSREPCVYYVESQSLKLDLWSPVGSISFVFSFTCQFGSPSSLYFLAPGYWNNSKFHSYSLVAGIFSIVHEFV
jgi:hypothetical protein